MGIQNIGVTGFHPQNPRKAEEPVPEGSGWEAGQPWSFSQFLGRQPGHRDHSLAPRAFPWIRLEAGDASFLLCFQVPLLFGALSGAQGRAVLGDPRLGRRSCLDEKVQEVPNWPGFSLEREKGSFPIQFKQNPGTASNARSKAGNGGNLRKERQRSLCCARLQHPTFEEPNPEGFVLIQEPRTRGRVCPESSIKSPLCRLGMPGQAGRAALTQHCTAGCTSRDFGRTSPVLRRQTLVWDPEVQRGWMDGWTEGWRKFGCIPMPGVHGFGSGGKVLPEGQVSVCWLCWIRGYF
ncbi:uncharacterized protein LOC126652752 [Myiozetetes cayanensis]|uniref:uncharacterized protein LOC126652752 n=1 Tax=Myiozetetes cayanensis TaxID=478635 RepID=UPI00215F417E|nr:uncharacterized protein LOC126652752 [Myiozetetes cayanensis]